ncbi:hypothetical protein [Halobellus rubicundus]|uniref:Uncharacterized protein n=1 Tax=Halobellus rubicundus TaxID=2996466 RepID=A0ABD5M818_9EURY
MEFDDDSFDTEYFENFLNQISSHEEWKWHPSTWLTLDETVTTASEGGTAEIELVHPDTDTVLYGQVPSEGHEHILTGQTRQALLSDPHPNQLPGPDSFEHQLADAYQSIAEDHKTDYLATAESSEDLTFDLLQVQIPMDYDPAMVQATMDELGAAAEEAYRLNQDIREPVQRYLE